MNKRIKVGTSAICISAIALAMLVITPSPMSRINLVMSAPTFDNNTAIAEVRIDNSTNSQICSFTDNNTTADVDIGENVMRLQTVVYIHSDYASDAAAAQANTRVYMTITAPDESVKFQDYLDNWAGGIEQQGDVWQVTKRDNTFTSFLLTEGTWTVETKYEVYA